MIKKRRIISCILLLVYMLVSCVASADTTISNKTTETDIHITTTSASSGLTLYEAVYLGGSLVDIFKKDIDLVAGDNVVPVEKDFSSVNKDEMKIYLLDSNLTPYTSVYSIALTNKKKITYGDGKNDFVYADANGNFTLPVTQKRSYEFLGYYTNENVQVTDIAGKKLSGYTVKGNISVTPKYQRLVSDADTKAGELLGNPLKAYYKSTGFASKISRNPWDLVVYDGKVYLGGGYYGGSWNSAPPMSTYDIASGEWTNVDFAVKMYEALDADSTEKKWYTLPSTKSNSSNVVNQSVGIIPVTTDCEISNFRFINGKPIALGADSINGNTWADGTVSTSTPTDGQKSVANNLGNYYTVEEDENGNERWVEYRNNILHGTHVYDVIEIDYNGEKTLMFAVGTSGTPMPAKILANKNTKYHTSPKFYLKNGTEYTGNSNNRIYNFFKTDEGIFAYYAHQGGTAKKIFKYNFTNNEHRFDEVRDIAIDSSSDDTKNYQQSDVDKDGNAITNRRLWTDFMKAESYNGFAYYTTGYLYKTKTFVQNQTTAISAPNSAIITDLVVRDGNLYALGFVKTNEATNAYTNYIWSINANDQFTQIRTFTSTGAYALSFDKDEDFFYVGLGGPTTHITSTDANVGNILKFSINSLIPAEEYTVTFDANGGTSTSSQQVTEGEKATKPSDPTRTGYTFAGWYNEAAGTTAFNFDTAITGPKTVYAKWTANKYTLSFNSDGGSSVSSKSVTYNSAIGTLTTPTKSGYTFAGWTIDGTKVTSTTVYKYTANKTAKATWTADKYKVTYGEGANDYVEATKGASFTLPVTQKQGYNFLGYFTEADVQVTDASGNSLSTFALTSNITVVAKYQRIPTEADSETGQLIGNPLKAYYKSTGFASKMARNPQDLVVYDGKVYIGGGYYGGGWISAPPMSVYDTETGTWSNVDFAVKMYEALDADSTAKKWYTLPSTKSDSNNVNNKNAGIIPVTTDCEISSFRFINGKPVAFGADSINGNTWADGIVSTKTPSAVDANDTQKYVANNLGNYYIVEEDENGNERWVEYRNNVLHGTHVYDAVEIDYNGGKTLMFAIGGGAISQLPAKILTNKATKSYASPKFYLKDGSTYTVTDTTKYHRIYNFFKTDEGIFAFYSLQGGSVYKIFKYNFTNNEHRFDEVRDITINATTSDTKNYQQSDVNSSGTAISTRRLWTDFMKTETYNGFAYYTTGYLYKTKTFVKSETTAISAPNSAIITDLITRDGKLYALGFKKTNSTTNAYTNYIWSINANDQFTQIRTFTSTGAYALSFDKDEEFFYVGLGGPTTHITSSVTNVGNILKLSINPIQ